MKPKVGDPILAYNPFKFSEESKEQPIDFYIEFVGGDNIKYKYEISFLQKAVVKEELNYWPNKKIKMLFQRLGSEDDNSLVHTALLGGHANNAKIEVFHNQAVLSKFGEDFPDKIISKVYMYLRNIDIINACNSRKVKDLRQEMLPIMKSNPILHKRISELIRFADTGIKSISIEEPQEKDFVFPNQFLMTSKKKLLLKINIF